MPGELLFMGLQGEGHNLTTKQQQQNPIPQTTFLHAIKYVPQWFQVIGKYSILFFFLFYTNLFHLGASLVFQTIKKLPAMRKTQ